MSSNAPASQQVRPSVELAKTKYMFQCRQIDLEITDVDGKVTNESQKVLAVNIPGATNGWELTGFSC
jgi:hypothetical protein